MSRLTNTILGEKGYGKGRGTPMVDLVNGGQFGFQTDMPSYVSNSQYVRRNVIARLINAPRGFQYLPDPEKWIAALKALVELHPKSIEGFNAQLTVDVQEQPFGGSGEAQESVANVTRARSNPSFGYVEKYGRPITTFFDAWITELLMDPITKAPNIVTRAENQGKLSDVDLLPDFIGATMIFFEPDPTFTRVDKAWLCTNMFPKAGAPIEARRDLTAGGDQVEFNIEFTAISQVGYGVNQFAQRLLDDMNLSGTNPNLRPAFIEQLAGKTGPGAISADVTAVESGYAEQIGNAARTAVQL